MLQDDDLIGSPDDYDSPWKDLLDEQRSGYTGIGASISNFDRGVLRICSRIAVVRAPRRNRDESYLGRYEKPARNTA